jgi:hypothetical protein
MNKIKLAHFDDPKWTYKQLCKYAQRYRGILKNKIRAFSLVHDWTNALATENIYSKLERYNSIPRYLLIKRLTEVQAFLYK